MRASSTRTSYAAWDTVPRGIPCRVGYRAAWDTVPRGIPCREGYGGAWDTVPRGIRWRVHLCDEGRHDEGGRAEDDNHVQAEAVATTHGEKNGDVTAMQPRCNHATWPDDATTQRGPRRCTMSGTTAAATTTVLRACAACAACMQALRIREFGAHAQAGAVRALASHREVRGRQPVGDEREPCTSRR